MVEQYLSQKTVDARHKAGHDGQQRL